jgi:hypothetical protein
MFGIILQQQSNNVTDLSGCGLLSKRLTAGWSATQILNSLDHKITAEKQN